MDCRVKVEAAVSVYDVETVDEAVSIAISKTGEMLNPDLNYVDINKSDNDGREPAFVAADEGLVGLELVMKVFNVEGDEHASRVARKEIGQQLSDVPLTVVSVEEIEQEDDSDSETDGDDSEPEAPNQNTGVDSDGDADELPEFEDIVDE